MSVRDLRPAKGREVFVIKAKWNGDCFCDLCYDYVKSRCLEFGMRQIPKPQDKEFYAPTGFLNFKCPHNDDKRLVISAYEGIK